MKAFWGEMVQSSIVSMSKCSVCGCDFDLETEGGIEGDFGILPVAFCPTCYTCMFDMVQQNCWKCIEESEEEEWNE